MVGQTISHYRIVEKLGEGGMGVVYKARDTRLDRFLALKVLPPDKFIDPERRRRFAVEAKAASALNHPNIVAIYDIETADGVDFIAMEYAEGETLDERIARKGLSPKEAFRVAIQIADALAAAHAAGIVHRDLKPSNIMVGADGRVRILDFGLAKLTEAAEPELSPTQTMKPITETGQVLGTVAYMSPEQAEGRKVDARSDTFSFGVVLYEMLTRQHPFRRESMVTTMAAIVSDEPKAWAELGLSLPAELERAVLRCLRKEPQQRWQSMSDLRVVLEELKESSESRGLVGGAPVARGVRRWWKLGLAALVVAAAAGGTAWWLHTRSARQPTSEMERLTFDPGLVAYPAISPDGRMVAYSSDRAGLFDIYVQQLHSPRSVRLTNNGVDNSYPVFSPDGTKIAFRSERDGGGIYIVDALGGGERKLVSEGNLPSFSPDGSTIAYVVTYPLSRRGKLYLVAANGGAPRQFQPDFWLPVAFSTNPKPLWSPDSKFLLFDGVRTGEPRSRDWWIAPVAGGEAQRVGAPPMAPRSRSRFIEAWRGKFVYYWEGTAPGSISIFRVPISSGPWQISGAPERLTSGPGWQMGGSVSADGQMVFFAAVPSMDLVWVSLKANEAAASGPAQPVLADSSSKGSLTAIASLATAANGSRLAYIAAINPESGAEIRIRDVTSGHEDVILPSIPLPTGLRLSADGSRAAYRDLAQGKLVTMVTDPGATSARAVCDSCSLLDFFSSPAAALILYRTQLVRQTLATGARQTLIADAGAVSEAAVSPGDRWVAFTTESPDGTARLYTAPVRPQPAPPAEWNEVAVERNILAGPRWSPNGKFLYYGSARDGFRCIWSQRMADDGKPAGPPVAVYHSHGSGGMKFWPLPQFGITPERLYMATAEIKGNVWTINVGRE